MQYEQILELVREVSKAGLSNFEYTEGDVKIAMSCPETLEHDTEVIKIKPETVVKEEPVAEKTGDVVTSPLVGTFYQAPSEDAEAFVKIGDKVKKGQVLGIVEAMKLMNEIESEYEGTITEILVENEQPVEYGQPLFRIGA
ncbi:MAG: acetyl-CoA carboxylase biotin carboxyl carrier protein [Lachnospiraceae bacterium]|nr:acetyl-CoA carboxylase biotin carboxyl carrier protein [Lachnospiraceae bacterium]